MPTECWYVEDEGKCFWCWHHKNAHAHLCCDTCGGPGHIRGVPCVDCDGSGRIRNPDVSHPPAIIEARPVELW